MDNQYVLLFSNADTLKLSLSKVKTVSLIPGLQVHSPVFTEIGERLLSVYSRLMVVMVLLKHLEEECCDIPAYLN